MSQNTAFPANPRELSGPEQILLGATRLWVSKAKSMSMAFDAVDEYFGYFGLSDAAQSHSTILYHCAAAATRPIYINCLNCADLSRDEARIVQAIGFAQTDRTYRASHLLSSWMKPSAVRITMPAVTGLANAMTAKKLIVPVRPWQITADPMPFTDHNGPYAPSSQLVH